MKFSGSWSWMLALTLSGFIGVATSGCKAEAQVKVNSEPPPPPPPADQDGDGIPDTDDKCVAEAEDGNPPDPQDGCPNKDLDGDGIAIPTDKCPDQPETVNDFEDEDGCPDKKPIVQLKEKKVQINQKIQFKKNSAAIEPGSQEVIDAVADVLTKHPEVQLVAVGGHASKEGGEWYNRKLTQDRVGSVVDALVAKGVDKTRLVSQGYGYYCPVDQGDSEEALEKNRRVEFDIVYRKGKKLDVTLGCEEATKKGINPPKIPELKADKKDEKKDAKAADAKKAPEAKPAAAAAKAADAKKADAKPAEAKPADAAKAEAPKK